MTSYEPEPQPQEPNKEPLTEKPMFLAGFALITIAVLVMAILLSIFTLVTIDSPTPAPTLVTATASLTPTVTPQAVVLPTESPTLAPLPTFTPQAEGSSTPTPTMTLTPTSTPTTALGLKPAYPLEDNDFYHLADWTPGLATQLIEILNAYPDTLSTYARGEDNSGYFQAYRYAITAQREALLQFPAAPQADDWTWDMAYNLARVSNPLAGDVYAALITDALNKDVINLENIYEWDKLQTYRLTIELIPFNNTLDDLSNHIVKISTEINGASYFWLVESAQGFEAYPLSSDFDFINPTTVEQTISDLTGDGGIEIAIYRSPIIGDYYYSLPHIFNLNIKPPVELLFEPFIPPAIGPDFINTWVPVEDPDLDGDLQFLDTVFDPCPVTVRHLYDWKSRIYQFTAANYELNIDPDLLNYCELVVDHSTNVWGLDVTVQLMEDILPYWPPETDVYDDPYAPDALDEWRFRLGLYHALLGHVSTAKSYFQGIIDNPSIPNSTWIEPSQSFIDTYQTQRDIYKACLPSAYCDPQLALESLVNTFTVVDYQDAVEVFKESGVTVRSHGYFDFDLDGTTEQWLIIRHYPSSKLEFWIMSRVPDGVTILFLDNVLSNQPRIKYIDPDQTPPIVLVEPDITFIYDTQQSTQEPFIVFVETKVTYSADITETEINILENALLSGIDPALIRDQLIELSEETFFTCNYINCPHYFYLLGLANELSGYPNDAVDAYLEVWRNYPDSPYTTMARFKLEGEAVPPSETPTPTQTETPTVTLTTTITGTPPTPTQSSTPTITTTPATATPSPTSTFEVYPAPSETLPAYP